jgi:hypothetical protein
VILVTYAFDQWLSTLNLGQAKIVSECLPTITMDRRIAGVRCNKRWSKDLPQDLTDQLRAFSEKHGEVGIKELEQRWINRKNEAGLAGRESMKRETTPSRIARLEPISETLAAATNANDEVVPRDKPQGVHTSCCGIL